jgi:hypothetical protein
MGSVGLNDTVSGVVSRKVLPACGGLCYFCPGLRARSRQPVKRYKKIIADIFPATQVLSCSLPTASPRPCRSSCPGRNASILKREY